MRGGEGQKVVQTKVRATEQTEGGVRVPDSGRMRALKSFQEFL